MTLPAPSWYTPEEYLAFERKAEFRHEYINGRIYPRHGSSRWHNLIAGGTAVGISTQFKGRLCEVYVCGMRVKVNAGALYAYPDVVAVCGEPRFEDAAVDTLTNPTVIVEVLSPSTEAYDRGEKFRQYRRLESLAEYVLIAQDKVQVEHYARHGEKGDQWVLTEISDLGGTLHLASIGCGLALADIYDKVSVQPTAE
jgi:Uma2 family endonuclease